MGEGTSRVGKVPGHISDGTVSDRTTAQALGGEIATVRYELDELLAELDRRRHELFDVRLQLRRHALGATFTTLAFLATAAAGVGLNVWRQHRRQRLTAQAGRLRHAISRMTEYPERIAAEPTIPGKIIAAAASAAAAALVKKLLERGVERLREPVNREAYPVRSSQINRRLPRAA
jgi:hypothetical protein